MKYEKYKIILVETTEKYGTLKVGPSGKMYPCHVCCSTSFDFKFYHISKLYSRFYYYTN